MRQGASRAALAVRGHDLYETQPEAVRALVRVEPLPKVIWEPAAGRGAISRVLEAAGHTVIKTDLVAYQGADPGIEGGHDFLLARKAPAGCGLIVTNPPFKHDDEFIEQGLSLGCRVIVLLRAMYPEAVDGGVKESRLRSRLVDNHLTHEWLGMERLPMMHRDGYAGKKLKQSGTPFAWFCFLPERHPASQGWITRRMSWRD